jgi:hypothetical protein
MNIKHKSTQADKDRADAAVAQMCKNTGIPIEKVYAIHPSVQAHIDRHKKKK